MEELQSINRLFLSIDVRDTLNYFNLMPCFYILCFDCFIHHHFLEIGIYALLMCAIFMHACIICNKEQNLLNKNHTIFSFQTRTRLCCVEMNKFGSSKMSKGRKQYLLLMRKLIINIPTSP